MTMTRTTSVYTLLATLLVCCSTGMYAKEAPTSLAQKLAGSIGVHSFKWLLPQQSKKKEAVRALNALQALAQKIADAQLQPIEGQLSEDAAEKLRTAVQHYNEAHTALVKTIKQTKQALK